MSTQDGKPDGIESSSSVPTSGASSTPFTDMRQPMAPELPRDGHLEPRKLFGEPRADQAVEFLMNSIRRLQSEMDTMKKETQDLRRSQATTLTATQPKEQKEREAKVNESTNPTRIEIGAKGTEEANPMREFNELHPKDVHQQVNLVPNYFGQAGPQFAGTAQNGHYAYDSVNANFRSTEPQVDGHTF